MDMQGECTVLEKELAEYRAVLDDFRVAQQHFTTLSRKEALEYAHKVDALRIKLNNLLPSVRYKREYGEKLSPLSARFMYRAAEILGRDMAEVVRHASIKNGEVTVLTFVHVPSRFSMNVQRVIETFSLLPFSKIDSIGIQYSNIGSDGAIALARVLPLTQVKTLYAEYAHIGPKGFAALREALPKTKIQRFSFGEIKSDYREAQLRDGVTEVAETFDEEEELGHLCISLGIKIGI